MHDPSHPARRLLILAAIVGLAIIAISAAYEFSDTLLDFAQSITSGKLGRAQGHLHY